MIAAPSFSSPVRLVVQLLDGRDDAEQGHAAAGDDPFLGRRPGRVQGVLDAGLGLLHVGLGRGADADQGHAAGELGQPLLELLLVVLALGLLDLAAKLVDPPLDVGLLAGTLDDRGAVLVDLDLLGLAELAELEVLQLQPQVLADHRAAGQDRHVAEHRLAAVAEAGGLDGADVEHAAQLVDDQGGQGLALDVLGDDQERLARLGDLLEQRDHLAEAADLLLVKQDQRRPRRSTSIVVGMVTK